VRHVGERVAFVVAETAAQAREAAELIEIDYEPLPAVATVEDGSSGLTGSTKAGDKKEDAKKEEEPKKKGFGLGGLKQAVAPEKQSAQVSASGGSRGVGPDRAAKGGSNPAPVKVTVSSADVAEFKRGIA